MPTLASWMLLAALATLLPTLGQADVVLLSSGKRMTSGNISPTLKWQSSGSLLKGGCPAYVGIPGQCFSLNLTPKGQLQRRDESFSHTSSEDHYDITRSNEMDDESTLFDPEEDQPLDSEGAHQFTIAEDESDDDDDDQEDVEDFPESSGRLEKRETARQRIELFSWPPGRSGQTFMYRWAFYLAPVSTSTRFFHIAQLIRRGPATPLITLNAVNGKVFFSAPGIKGSRKNAESVPIQRFVGRTTQHIVRVKYGAKGNIRWVLHSRVLMPLELTQRSRWIVKDVKSRKTIMSFHASGNMGHNGSIKFGLYRRFAMGMKAARAFAGGYSARRLD
ncbi:hypothetical protein RQP46_003680 [Phenoliferia psychrophenolica]